MKRRKFIKLGVTSGSTLALTANAAESPNPLLKYLCPPDNIPRDLAKPSPPCKSFVTELFVPPVMKPVPQLDPAPDPEAHQLYDQFEPKKLYETHEVELPNWVYGEDGAYAKGSGSWGYRDGSSPDNPASTPGPTYKAWYGEPVLTRRHNDLPNVGDGIVEWALPSTSSHLHNGHTASESDGNPQDWIDPGEFWDHHYCNFPSGLTEPGHDPEQVNREKLSTLWYHDHRLDFTASNVYAGLDGFYFLYDEQDTGFENPTEEDTKFLEKLYGDKYKPEEAWNLPSGKYDVPLILHDVMFELAEDGSAQVRWNAWNTDGIIGDMYTVNRKIRPRYKVDGRKYRFRIINGGPSRFYELCMFKRGDKKNTPIPLTLITGDGNVLPQPIDAERILLSVAQRVDVVIDFAEFEPGEELVIVNLMEQVNGKGPSGRLLKPDKNADYGTSSDPGVPAQGIILFEVGEKVDDPSQIPNNMRQQPKIDLREVTQERLWTFDYDGGLWTINGQIFEPNRIDAGIAKNSTEVWTLRNTGNEWAHPIHCHFTEFLILAVNGRPFFPSYIQTKTERDPSQDQGGLSRSLLGDAQRPKVSRYLGGPRRDVATILPNDEMKVYMRFRDFIGKHIMHCHNVVHEDHAMMIRWDMLPEGMKAFGVGTDVEHGEPLEATEVFGNPTKYTYPNPRPAPVPHHLEERPGQGTFQDG